MPPRRAVGAAFANVWSEAQVEVVEHADVDVTELAGDVADLAEVADLAHTGHVADVAHVGHDVTDVADLVQRQVVADHVADGGGDVTDEHVEAVGQPSIVVSLPRWNAFHTTLLLGDHPAAKEHHAALDDAADALPFARTLSTAAHCWSQAGRGDVDHTRVESAAQELHAHGMRADAARLAAHAAMHTTDRKAMTQLLDIARQFHGTNGGPEVLSEREQEVAALVRGGLTYREVGDALFISAKTVEHHVTRIRNKLGVKNRRELERALADFDLTTTT